MAEHLRLSASHQLVDIGGGTGNFTAALADLPGTGRFALAVGKVSQILVADSIGAANTCVLAVLLDELCPIHAPIAARAANAVRHRWITVVWCAAAHAVCRHAYADA